MEKYLHKKEIEIPIYKGLFVIILTNNKKKLKKHIPNFNSPFIYASAFDTKWKKERAVVVALNFHFNDCVISPGVIAHEALHAAMFISEARGIELDYNNPEPLTYLTEWMTDEIYKFIDQHNFRTFI